MNTSPALNPDVSGELRSDPRIAFGHGTDDDDDVDVDEDDDLCSYCFV